MEASSVPRGSLREAELGLVAVPGGVTLQGNDAGDGYPQDGETPVHEVRLSPFRMGRHRQQRLFGTFVDDTATTPTRSGSAGRLCLPACCPTTSRRPRAWPRRPGGGGVRRRLVPSRGTAVDLDGRATIRSSTSRGPTPRRTAPGQGHGCRRRRSGSTPPAAASAWPIPLGRRSANPKAEHRMNVWQGRFPRENTRRTGTPGRHRWRPSPQRLRPVQHDRQRLGVVRRLVRPRLTTQRSARRRIPGLRAARTASSGAAPTCATTRTATATGLQREATTRLTASPATSGFASSGTPSLDEGDGGACRAQGGHLGGIGAGVADHLVHGL